MPRLSRAPRYARDRRLGYQPEADLPHHGEEGRRVRTKRQKKITRPRLAMPVPSAVKERWSMDFVSDQQVNGQRLQVLHIVDDLFRECWMDLNCFATLKDARGTIQDWRKHYNHVRSHRSLGRKPAAVFATEAA